ncbi:hypothetical protein D039_5322B, partial [Vibrio parahaemolyticus EKP-028]
NE